MKIGFIGLGNMATAIIGGLLREDTALSSEDGNVTVITAANIIGSAKTEATRRAKTEQFGIAVTASNREVAEAADVLVLAVKPQFFPEVIAEIRDAVSEKHPGYLHRRRSHTRAHRGPFRPRCYRHATHPLHAEHPGPRERRVHRRRTGARRNGSRRSTLPTARESFGRAIVIPERLMDAASATAGSSPAFVFMFIEALADGAVAAGMPRAQAYEFAAAAVAGSAQLVLETGRHPGDLKDMVCSPAGTTIEGVRALEEGAFRASVMNAISACVEKAKALQPPVQAVQTAWNCVAARNSSAVQGSRPLFLALL
ncbi:MAG: pyrroline-5-carboxylate reductase family protein [Adlercreutzia equolifaciens]